MDYDAQSLFLQKKGFFGPLILTAFLGIFGIIWIIFRALGNSNIDQQINFAFTNIKNGEEKIISELKKLYQQRKITTPSYFIIFFTFILFCIPGIVYYNVVNKHNIKINIHINKIMDAHKANKVIRKYNHNMIADFYLREKKDFYIFSFSFLFFLRL